MAPAAHESLPGGDAHDTAPIVQLGLEVGLLPDTVARCVDACGTEAAAIFNLAQRERALRARLHPDAPAIMAEVPYAVGRSFAVTLSDVLNGVLGFDLATRDGGAAAAHGAAVQLGLELGWPPSQVAAQGPL